MSNLKVFTGELESKLQDFENSLNEVECLLTKSGLEQYNYMLEKVQELGRVINGFSEDDLLDNFRSLDEYIIIDYIGNCTDLPSDFIEYISKNSQRVLKSDVKSCLEHFESEMVECLDDCYNFSYSKYDGTEYVWFRHSAIEYVYVIEEF